MMNNSAGKRIGISLFTVAMFLMSVFFGRALISEFFGSSSGNNDGAGEAFGKLTFRDEERKKSGSQESNATAEEADEVYSADEVDGSSADETASIFNDFDEVNDEAVEKDSGESEEQLTPSFDEDEVASAMADVPPNASVFYSRDLPATGQFDSDGSGGASSSVESPKSQSLAIIEKPGVEPPAIENNEDDLPGDPSDVAGDVELGDESVGLGLTLGDEEESESKLAASVGGDEVKADLSLSDSEVNVTANAGTVVENLPELPQNNAAAQVAPTAVEEVQPRAQPRRPGVIYSNALGGSVSGLIGGMQTPTNSTRVRTRVQVAGSEFSTEVPVVNSGVSSAVQPVAGTGVTTPVSTTGVIPVGTPQVSVNSGGASSVVTGGAPSSVTVSPGAAVNAIVPAELGINTGGLIPDVKIKVNLP